MSAVWIVVFVSGVGTLALKATGPVLLGGKPLPDRFTGIVSLLGPPQLPTALPPADWSTTVPPVYPPKPVPDEVAPVDTSSIASRPGPKLILDELAIRNVLHGDREWTHRPRSYVVNVENVVT